MTLVPVVAGGAPAPALDDEPGFGAAPVVVGEVDPGFGGCGSVGAAVALLEGAAVGTALGCGTAVLDVVGKVPVGFPGPPGGGSSPGGSGVMAGNTVGSGISVMIGPGSDVAVKLVPTTVPTTRITRMAAAAAIHTTAEVFRGRPGVAISPVALVIVPAESPAPNAPAVGPGGGEGGEDMECALAIGARGAVTPSAGAAVGAPGLMPL